MTVTDIAGIWSTGSNLVVPDEVGEPDPSAMQQLLAVQTGGELVACGGGEWRKGEKDWIIQHCIAVRKALKLPGFPPRWFVALVNKLRRQREPLLAEAEDRQATYLQYLLQLVMALPFRWRAKARIKAGHLPPLKYAERALEDHKRFKALKEQLGDKAAFMRGLPSPRAIKIFSGLLFGMLKPFENEMKGQVKQIFTANPRVVVQWEVPVELCFGSLKVYPKWLKYIIFRRFMTLFERLIKAAPAGSHFAFHLCWGDLNNKPFMPAWLRSDDARVIFTNVILRSKVWRHNGGDYELYGIHDPWGDGHNAATEADLAMFEEMDVFPEGVIYAAGVLHPKLSTEQIVDLIRLFAERYGVKVLRLALAAPCGDARKPGDQVAVQYMVALEALERLREHVV